MNRITFRSLGTENDCHTADVQKIHAFLKNNFLKNYRTEFKKKSNCLGIEKVTDGWTNGLDVVSKINICTHTATAGTLLHLNVAARWGRCCFKKSRV